MYLIVLSTFLVYVLVFIFIEIIYSKLHWHTRNITFKISGCKIHIQLNNYKHILKNYIITACAAARPQSLPGAEALGTSGGTAGGPASITSLTPDHQLREDFTVLAKDLVASLKGIVSTLVRTSILDHL